MPIANIDELIKLDYKEIKDSNNSKLIEIREHLFNIIAYCDSQALEGKKRNPERRIIAKAGVRQNAWVNNLLRWKHRDIISAKSVSHAIKYLQEPQENLTMLSERHREKFSLNVLEKAYEEHSFCKEVITFCRDSLPPNIEIQNENNRTWFYSCLIYDLKDEWLGSDVLGLVVRDNTGWQSDFLTKKYCSVGWDQVSCLEDLKEELRDLIAQKNSFPFYNISNNKACYLGNVIDFATNENGGFKSSMQHSRDSKVRKNEKASREGGRLKFLPCAFEPPKVAYETSRRKPKILYFQVPAGQQEQIRDSEKPRG